MIIERSLEDEGGIANYWKARIACDFPKCDRVLVVVGHALPGWAWTDDIPNEEAERCGWYVTPANLHLCGSSREHEGNQS